MPDFSTLKPVDSQPDFRSLKPVQQQTPQAQPKSLSDSIWSAIAGGSAGSSVGTAKASAFPANNPLENIRTGNSQDNLDVGKGALKQAAKDISSVGAQNAGPVGAAMKANAPEFAKSLDAFDATMKPSNPKQQQGALNTSIAETALPIGEAVKATAPIAANVASDIKTGANVLKTAVVGTPEEQASRQAAIAIAKQEALEKIAIKDATPAYDKSMIGEPAVNGVPRVQEGGGITKTRVVTPTLSEIAAGKELAKVPGYATAKTALEKFNSIQPEIASRGQALDASLADENVLRPPKEIKNILQNAVNNAAENSVLLQKADPAVTNYLRVAGRAIDQSPGNLAGERAVGKILDNAYEDAGGKYGNNKALDQIHRAARNALIDDIESKATNTEVKAALKGMSNLYKAADVLQDAARAEGGSKLERAMKANPFTTKALKTGANVTGLGAILHLVP